MTRPDEPQPLPPSEPPVETDDRFPSGPWTGFFLMTHLPGRHRMELVLTFREGNLRGEGKDWVGAFLVRGRYDVADGRCHWTKTYLGRHDVFYRGFNEGKGIWGTWEIGTTDRGGFHIWPVGMGDPTTDRLEAAEELPEPVVEAAEEAAAEPVAGAP